MDVLFTHLILHIKWCKYPTVFLNNFASELIPENLRFVSKDGFYDGLSIDTHRSLNLENLTLSQNLGRDIVSLAQCIQKVG